MSSDSTGDRPQDDKPAGKKLHIWGRPIEPPAAPSSTPEEDKSLSGADFHKNFPEADNAVTIKDAVKTIKPGDIFEVHKTACGRQGLMFGISAGAVIGGLRFVWRGVPMKAANWAVGGFLGGSILAYERCLYLRRLERLSMKRIVEVHQSDVAEKKRLKEEEEAKKKLEEQNKKKGWLW